MGNKITKKNKLELYDGKYYGGIKIYKNKILLHGKGVYNYNDGSSYKGFFNMNMRDGYGVYKDYYGYKSILK